MTETKTKNLPPHPLQPQYIDEHKIRRFRGNAIVEYLLAEGGIDLNIIARRPFSDADREQFAQLISYSVSGFGELPYVSQDTLAAVQVMTDDPSVPAHEARIAALEAKLEAVRDGLRGPMADLFGVHPDDLRKP